MEGVLGLLWLLSSAAFAQGGEGSLPHRSPFDVVSTPDGAFAFVSDRTAGVVVVVDLVAKRAVREIPLRGQPTGLCMDPAGGRLWAAEYGEGSVAEIGVKSGAVERRLPAGLRPMGLALAPRRKLLIACNTVSDDVSLLDLASGKEVARVAASREPFFAAVTPDERLAVVGNLLPATPASDPGSSAALSLLDLEKPGQAEEIRLPSGSTSVREVAISPDGRWAYCAHTVGRFTVPAVQLDRGWVYTNAVSAIDLGSREVHATMLLDSLVEGAANPWGVELSGDGLTLWVSLRGVHEVAALDLGRLGRLLSGDVPEELAAPAPRDLGTQNFWHEIRKDPSRRKDLIDDLGALHAAGVIRRLEIPGRGPRGMDLTRDGKTLLVSSYHSGALVVLDPAGEKLAEAIPVGPGPEPDRVRRGEMVFHDGEISFQHWMSCSSCHPDEGRADGLRWDLPNDGLGTPQRTRSLLWAHRARPTTARGVRPGIEASAAAGFHFLGVEAEGDQVESVIAYLTSLAPEPSPHLTASGKLTEKAARGQALFEGKAGCASCHHGPSLSDHRPHDVGTAAEVDRPDEKFITKRLVELYRSAPFLHDGRAPTLREVFTTHNPRQRHGRWHDLDSEEKEDLLSFLLSL